MALRTAQRGRLREFWQFNADIFGVSDIAADHEIIQLADAIMEAFGAKRDMYIIKFNSRQLINSFLLDHLQLDETQANTLIRLIDRMHKVPPAEFSGLTDAIFTPSQRESGVNQRLHELLTVTSLDDLPKKSYNLTLLLKPSSD